MCKIQNYEEIECIINYGVNITIKDSDDESLLIILCKNYYNMNNDDKNDKND